MRAVLGNPRHAANFSGVDLPAAVQKKVAAELVNDVARGDAPGRDAIARFYRGTLDRNNIEAALKVWRDTGELAGSGRRHPQQPAEGRNG